MAFDATPTHRYTLRLRLRFGQRTGVGFGTPCAARGDRHDGKRSSGSGRALTLGRKWGPSPRGAASYVACRPRSAWSLGPQGEDQIPVPVPEQSVPVHKASVLIVRDHVGDRDTCRSGSSPVAQVAGTTTRE